MPDRPPSRLRANAAARGAAELPDPTDPALEPVTAPYTDPEDSLQIARSAAVDDPSDPLLATAPLTPLPAEPRPAPLRTTLHPGVVLDRRYQLQRHVRNRGAMQLWQGEDQILARPVAIRLVIDSGTDESNELVSQLLGAARRSGQLVHSGAASTYDATTTSADGLPLAYVISEWVQGISLLDLLRDGPLMPERAASVQLMVAKVIAAAHAAGVTHGDLHPGDVVITAHGLVKVLDLEMRSTYRSESLAERQERDVAGLGALLYASVTGRWPLGGGRGLPAAEIDANGFCRPPRQLRAGVSRELDALTMSALGDAVPTATPGRPRPTAAQVVDTLEGLVASSPTGSQPAITDDDPHAYTEAGQQAKAAHAERMARETAQRRRAARRRYLPVVLLVVLALAAWLVGVAVGKLPGESHKGSGLAIDPSAPPSGAPLKPANVVDFDPLGDGAEDPGQVAFATDGNPQTAWTTEAYYGSQWGGSLTKTGVGLKVDLGRSVTVSQVRLLFEQPGVNVELRYADADSASADSYTVAATSGPSPKALQVLTPRTGAHRYWLIWLTALPHQATAQGVTYQAGLAELKFYG